MKTDYPHEVGLKRTWLQRCRMEIGSFGVVSKTFSNEVLFPEWSFSAECRGMGWVEL